MKRVHVSLFLLCFSSITHPSLFSSNKPRVSAAFTKAIELVQNVPEETENILEIPTVRQTKDVWLEMIESARQTIDIGAFYFAVEPPDPLSLELARDMRVILDALKNAATRGIKVRIITDLKYYSIEPKGIEELRIVPGIELRLFDQKTVSNGVMHAKYMIVDAENSFVGSQNFDWSSLHHIRELGIRVRNKQLAQTITQVFDIDWRIATPTGIVSMNTAAYSKKIMGQHAVDPVNREHPVRIRQNGETITIWPAFSPAQFTYANLDTEEKTIVSLIDSAKKSVCVQVMSFTPYNKYDPTAPYYGTLEDALKRAAERNVMVKLIFSDWTIDDKSIEAIKLLSQVPNISIQLSSIPQWSGGFIPMARLEHEKYMIVDEQTLWIGTSNWSKSYFTDCRNLGLVVKSPHYARLLTKAFMRNWDGPYTQRIDIMKNYIPPKVR